MFAAVCKSLVGALEAEIIAAIEAAPAMAQTAAGVGLRLYCAQRSDPLTARMVLIEIFGVPADIDRS